MDISWFIQKIVFAEIVFLWCHNGGLAVFIRTIITGVIVSLFVLIVYCRLLENPSTINDLEYIDWLYVGRCNLLEDWWKYCGIFAAVYTSYYARFVSQWSYISNLYNQIKNAEISMCLNCQNNKCTPHVSVTECNNSLKLNGWKVGFIEDAETLHMETKPLFAGVILTWLENSKDIAEV